MLRRVEPGPSIASGGRQSRARGIVDRIESRLEAERDQLALWIPVGMGAGVAAWFLMPSTGQWGAFVCATCAIAFAGLGARSRLRCIKCLGVVSLMAAIGCALIWIRAERLGGPQLERPVTSRFTAEIVTTEPLPNRELVRVLLTRASDRSLPRQFRVNIAEADAPPELRPGSRILLTARLLPPPEPAVPGAYEFARRAWFEQLGATGRSYGESEIQAAADTSGWRVWRDSQRIALAAHVADRLGGAEGAIAAVLATGDRGRLDERDAEAMRRSGLAHLLAISGLHVTAVVGVTFFFVLRILALVPRLALDAPLILIAAASGAGTGFVYTVFTGGQVPTVRACIAALVVLLGIAIGRDAITMRMVAAGAVVVLMLWPETLVGPSFQMSFAAVVAIIALHDQPTIRRLVSRRDEHLLKKIGRFGLGLFITGLAVELALMPIALFHFSRAGLYGALANIVAIPLTSFIVIPLEALALGLEPFGMAEPVWWIVRHALGLILALAHKVAATPGSQLLMPTMSSETFALIITGGLWLLLWRTNWRLWGLLPVTVGVALATLSPPADVLITGDGRHVALHTGDGSMFLLRPAAGDYVRDVLSETLGIEPDVIAPEFWPNSECSRDSCRILIWRGGRQWRLFATRSGNFLPYDAVIEECALADIVVSDRSLPAGCHPRWLRADRDLLRETGGLAINLTRGTIETVRQAGDDHPWRR